MARISDEEFDKRYPEHAKADDVKVERQAIGEFIELGGYTLAYWNDSYDGPEGLQPVHLSINEVLAKYFEIDLKVLEAEKQAMLAELTGGGS